jgi:NDP-hexose-3-ketoreductase
MTAFSYDPIRVGIIGCSNIARKRFLPALIRSNKAKLQSIGSRELTKARSFSELFQCQHYGNYEDVIYSDDVDLVYISTPPTKRMHILEAAIRAGKHVLCEKPLLSNVADTIEILALAANCGVRIFENYAYLSHPQHSKLKELLSKNIIGKIKSIYVTFTYPLPLAGDIRLNPCLGGGVINDSLGYPISLAVFLYGDSVKIMSSSIGFSDSLGVDKNCQFQALVGDQTFYSARVAMDENYKSSYLLTGDSGEIEVTRAFSVDENHAATINITTESGRVVETLALVNQFNLYLEQCILELNDRIMTSERNIFRVRTFMDAVIGANVPFNSL